MIECASMNLSHFDYSYPKKLIAQYPSEQRDESRLLVAHRKTKKIQHLRFKDIVQFFESGDCLVVNQSKVIPARIFGKKTSGGKVETLLLHKIESNTWRSLLSPMRGLKIGTKIVYEKNVTLEAEVLEIDAQGVVTLGFLCDGNFENILEKIGHVPLPPYIERADISEDHSHYQTIFAKEKGSVAAPTAGFHWTPNLIEAVKKKGMSVVPITLHVGAGTFLPIRSKNILDHKMHSEYVEISLSAANLINSAKRIIAVGTTTVRALETAFSDGELKAYSGWTNLFMTQLEQFRVIDILQTNFHQPKSTLFVMVSAFAGLDFIRKCYDEAMRHEYRLFSYGDAMVIL